jgi:hypothetical protein
LSARSRSSLVPSLLLAATATFCLFCAYAGSASAAGVLAWGDNQLGTLGIGTSERDIETPTALSGSPDVVQISSNGRSTLALLADGSVMAWGYDRFGAVGLAGRGMGENAYQPVRVQGISNAVAVAAGETFSLALLADGTVVAWGGALKSELGEGSKLNPGELTETCDGISGHCRRTPKPVPGATDVVAIAAGVSTALALRSDGTVLAWGDDRFEQTTTPPNREPTGYEEGGCVCTLHPVVVSGVSGAVAIAASEDTDFALLADGTVKGWGRNDEGQVGSGTVSPATGCACLPSTTVQGLSGADMLAVRNRFMYARTAGGAVSIWPAVTGPDSKGNFTHGVGPASMVDGISGPIALAPGYPGLALRSDGSVSYLWDQAREDEDPRHSGGIVPGITGASGVAAGGEDSFALVGPAQSLTVQLAGHGAGKVGGPQGILCPPSCGNEFVQNSFQSLTAQAATEGFAGFTGACSGTGPCRLKMGSDQTVTATFGKAAGSKIAKAKINSKRKIASFKLSAPGAITGYECELVKPRAKKKATKPKTHRKAAHSAAVHKKTKAKAPRVRFAKCGATKTYKRLAPGRYTFKARALDILGADPKPAVRHFTIRVVRRHRKAHKGAHKTHAHA